MKSARGDTMLYFNDYSRMIRMLTKTEVAFTVQDTSGGGKSVSVHACTSPSNEGQEGLYTCFVFSSKGRLESIGTWDRIGCAG